MIWLFFFGLSSPPVGFSSILLLAAAEALFLGEYVCRMSVSKCVCVCVSVCVRACVRMYQTCTWLLQERSCCICSHGAQRSAHFGLAPNWQLYLRVNNKLFFDTQASPRKKVILNTLRALLDFYHTVFDKRNKCNYWQCSNTLSWLLTICTFCWTII